MDGGAGRIAELDGLRGVAVLLVVAGHTWTGVAPAYIRLIPSTNSASGLAFLGVNIFFVLSGYLITTRLVQEHDGSGGVALRAFYGRRARRLLPALVLVVAFYAVYGLAVGHAPGEVGGTALRSLLYVENVGDLLHIPTTGWLGHTWSLAVEEQFYLVWPIVFIWAAAKGRDAVALVAIAGTIATIVTRAMLARRGVDTYETMHWDALLIGGFIAVHPWNPPRWAVWTAVLGVSAQIGWYLASSGRAPMTSLQYIGLAVAGAIFVLHAPRVPWLSSRALRHCGTISYGLYLWHALLYRAGWPIPVALGLALLASEASYYGVERRFVRHRAGVAPGGVDSISGEATLPAALPHDDGSRDSTAQTPSSPGLG